MVKKISSSEFEQVKNNKAIIVDFSAEWCGPCKMLAPVMEQLSDEITDVEFYNIDVKEAITRAKEIAGIETRSGGNKTMNNNTTNNY